jgi:hypothetical protein
MNEPCKCDTCGLKSVCSGVNKGYFAGNGDIELKQYNNISEYEYYFHQKRIGCDIIIPAYKMDAKFTQMLNELPFKTRPPYNLHIINKIQTAANNRQDGLNMCNEEYIIMCDDDIVNLPDDWNRLLIEPLMYNPEIMAVSARLYDKDGNIGLNSANNFDLNKDYVEVNLIPTACCAFRKNDVLKTKAHFPKEFLGSGWEDSCFFMLLKQGCEKLGLGTKIIINNKCKVTHLNEEKNNSIYFNYNKQIYMEKIYNE